MNRIIPMLFNTEMTLAILDGRKRYTRRICRDANDLTVPDMSFFDAEKRTYAVHNYADAEHKYKLSLAERTCPICPGDIIYVRETWSEWTDGYLYRAWNEPFPQPGESALMKWHPSIHMPKEAARIWLKVTDVKVERLQDMHASDVTGEGLHFNRPHTVNEMLAEFSKLWDSTIKKPDISCYGWNANPWVWIIGFKRCDKPENWE